jgi:pimeloyl-ACP methyl ester carboxylesterase
MGPVFTSFNHIHLTRQPSRLNSNKTKPKASCKVSKVAPLRYQPLPPRPGALQIQIQRKNIVQVVKEGRLGIFDLEGNQLQDVVELDPKQIWVKQPSDTQFHKLRDGRTLCYSRLGRTKAVGPVLVLFHGTPGSRLSYHGFHTPAEAKGIRIIAIDRPGFGHSTFVEGKTVLDLASDVEELLDALGVDQVLIIGVSGGGPVAIACAHHFSQKRLVATGVMAGCAPSTESSTCEMAWIKRLIHWANLYTPKLLVACLEYGSKYASRILTWHHSGLNKIEGYRQGFKGYVVDNLRNFSDWGFDVRKVRSNKIYVYHGTADANCPISWGHFYRDQIPNVEWNPKLNEDHHTLQSNWTFELLDKLLMEWKKHLR